MNESFLIIGGDKRQEYLKKFLSDKFKDVFHVRYPADIGELDEIGSYTHIILPLPISKDKELIYSSDNLCLKIEDVVKLIKPFHTVCSSAYDNKTLDYFEDKNIEFYDFMKDKFFKKANAYLTAQGVLRLLLENAEDYIIGKKALILGFGDVSKSLAELLSKLGLEVYIAARNINQLHLASLKGYKTLKLTSVSSCIFIFDYIFGTIPAIVLKKEDVKSMGNDSIYFELASAPYSANKEDFVNFGKKYFFGSALPGRFLPKASAELIADFILGNL